MRSRGGEEQRMGSADKEEKRRVLLAQRRRKRWEEEEMNSLLGCEGSGSAAAAAGYLRPLVWEFVDVRLLASPHVWFFQTVQILTLDQAAYTTPTGSYVIGL